MPTPTEGYYKSSPKMGGNLNKKKKPTNEEKTRSEIRNILERKHPKITDKKERSDKTGTERAADELHREAVKPSPPKSKPKPTTKPPKFGGGNQSGGPIIADLQPPKRKKKKGGRVGGSRTNINITNVTPGAPRTPRTPETPPTPPAPAKKRKETPAIQAGLGPVGYKNQVRAKNVEELRRKAEIRRLKGG
ncbi:uncharacterized protein METZ01_LOCUS120280 [marine metagenome]|uniref:Uncharacterized protein n=1 Tax=marine metagenome TaxID=408172 RepID=A0A381XRK6_9ZZZZ